MIGSSQESKMSFLSNENLNSILIYLILSCDQTLLPSTIGPSIDHPPFIYICVSSQTKKTATSKPRGSTTSARPKIQCKRAPPFRYAHIQTIYILRSLWFPVVRPLQTGPAMRGVQYECAQTMPEKCGKQLWH